MDTRTGLPVAGLVGDGYLVRLTRQAAMTLGQTPHVADPASLGDAIGRENLRLLFAECDAIAVVDGSLSPDKIMDICPKDIVLAPGEGATRLVHRSQSCRDERMRLVALTARSPFGQIASYPLVEVRDCADGGIETLTPAPDVSDDAALAAQRLTIDLAHHCAAVGLLSASLVKEPGGWRARQVTAGPHPAGLWTVDGARTSQFEQYLRAILDYPLGETTRTAPAVVTRTVVVSEFGGMTLDERLHHVYGTDPGARAYLYGVIPRPGATIGHVTILGDDTGMVDDLRMRTARAVRWLREGTDESTENRRDHGKRLGLADHEGGR